MAVFETAYRKYILPNEGGYANVTADKGGETYAGIARNFHPNWQGWVYIDAQKKRAPIPHNQKFPDIQYLVDDFYLQWWNRNRFGEFKSQELADFMFDFNVHSSTTAIKILQRLVGVTADGVIGPATIAAVNKADQVKLYAQLKEEREKLFHSLVQKDPSQQKFLTGWLARLSKFPSAIGTPATVSIIALIGVGIVIAYFVMTSDSDKRTGNKVEMKIS